MPGRPQISQSWLATVSTHTWPTVPVDTAAAAKAYFFKEYLKYIFSLVFLKCHSTTCCNFGCGRRIEIPHCIPFEPDWTFNFPTCGSWQRTRGPRGRCRQLHCYYLIFLSVCSPGLCRAITLRFMYAALTLTFTLCLSHTRPCIVVSLLLGAVLMLRTHLYAPHILEL